jgi:hypothetical protein
MLCVGCAPVVSGSVVDCFPFPVVCEGGEFLTPLGAACQILCRGKLLHALEVLEHRCCWHINFCGAGL